ncbi:galectin-4-like isoform X2 [Pomacea canaliculata]|uniref:galectin-4-like isoform X2 n=1 Tax=Pomacea canaliculata TaxID=400727 RepID=UPI000D728FD8|nr:galectin-4-like isoform X2 [Pomacea canaliculata]
MTTISPVHIPYSGGIPGGVHDGLEIQIQGTVPHHAREGFSINLCQGGRKEPNTTLHFNPRLNQNCVVLNHMQNGAWGSEERRNLPFQKGAAFDLHIKVKPQVLKIKINGSHFTDFGHRMPKETAQFLLIEGEVAVSFIRFSGRQGHGHSEDWPKEVAGPAVAEPFVGGRKASGRGRHHRPWNAGFPMMPQFPGGGGFAQPGMEFQPPPYSPYPMGAVPPPAAYPGGAQPIYNPPVPFTSGIPGGLSPGRMIYISGIPNQHPSRFTINLQSDYGATDVALHFDVRFNFGDSRNVVVRNHCQRGQWGSEERQVNYFPFMPNANFDLMILAEHSSFKVAVNNQHFLEFRHRLPIHSASILSVSGDVRLTQVRFQ